MPESQNPFEMDFESYILQSEPSKQERAGLWRVAIGLQRVDGLAPSEYLYETARRNIEGEITIEEAKRLIDSYYECARPQNAAHEASARPLSGDGAKSKGGAGDDAGKEEADKVSVRICEILKENTFSFTPDLLLSIHKRLFSGIFRKVKAGAFRDYNITKKEWALDGESVLYANADMIRQTLEYDFAQEKAFDYSRIPIEEKVRHLARFVANIWQVHPFGEGNTRTTAVFAIKYLNSLGFKVNNETFDKSSWYFRNSLVRANYTNMAKGIYMNAEYLERFFRNLLLGESNELKNRYVHIRYSDGMAQSASPSVTVNVTVKLTANQKSILGLVKENPNISQEAIAAELGLARETVNRNMRKLQERHVLERLGADKNGRWKIAE